MAITWRTIDIGSNAGANALVANASETIQRSIQGLGNVGAQIGQRQQDDWNAVANNNTTDIVTRLNSITDLDELQKETQGGAFNLESLDNTFGRQYNKAVVSDAIGARTEYLQKEALLKQAREETEANKVIAKEKLNRTRVLDNALAQLSSQFTDPSELQAHGFAKARELNTDNLLSGAEVNQLINTYKDRLTGIGLNDSEQLELNSQTAKASSYLEAYTNAIDQQEQAFKRSGGFNEAIEADLNDRTTMNDAIDSLSASISKSGKAGNKDVNEQKISGELQKISRMFKEAGLAAPTGRVLTSLLRASGHDDEFLFDAEYELDADLVNNYIRDVKQHQNFKQQNVANLLEFQKQKANITELATGIINNNRSEITRAAKTRGISTQTYSPQLRSIDDVDLAAKEALDILSRIIPAGTKDKITNENVDKTWVPDEQAKPGLKRMGAFQIPTASK